MKPTKGCSISRRRPRHARSKSPRKSSKPFRLPRLSKRINDPSVRSMLLVHRVHLNLTLDNINRVTCQPEAEPGSGAKKHGPARGDDGAVGGVEVLHSRLYQEFVDSKVGTVSDEKSQGVPFSNFMSTDLLIGAASKTHPTISLAIVGTIPWKTPLIPYVPEIFRYASNGPL